MNWAWIREMKAMGILNKNCVSFQGKVRISRYLFSSPEKTGFKLFLHWALHGWQLWNVLPACCRHGTSPSEQNRTAGGERAAWCVTLGLLCAWRSNISSWQPPNTWSVTWALLPQVWGVQDGHRGCRRAVPPRNHFCNRANSLVVMLNNSTAHWNNVVNVHWGKGYEKDEWVVTTTKSWWKNTVSLHRVVQPQE